MKRVINAFLFFSLIILLLATLSVGKDYLFEQNRSLIHIFVFLLFAILEIKGIKSTYRKAFPPQKTVYVPQAPQMMPQQMMPQQMMPMAPNVEPNPEMDHVDDMAVQYNPYFSDVYEEQLAAQREKQQMIQKQLEQQQELQQQILQQQQIIREQVLQQQMMQDELARQAGDQTFPPNMR
ncbi:MAG: hypothetical protein J5645_08325 [Lachnospiraceae bacterium]|nr:hypothetical protein [Lachnospiraceae bacterium]